MLYDIARVEHGTYARETAGYMQSGDPGLHIHIIVHGYKCT